MHKSTSIHMYASIQQTFLVFWVLNVFVTAFLLPHDFPIILQGNVACLRHIWLNSSVLGRYDLLDVTTEPSPWILFQFRMITFETKKKRRKNVKRKTHIAKREKFSFSPKNIFPFMVFSFHIKLPSNDFIWFIFFLLFLFLCNQRKPKWKLEI